MMQQRKQRGLTLIELMVALLLGVIITLAATQMFSVNSQTFQLQQAQAQLQEEGTLLMRFLADDIRLAGLFDETSGQAGVEFTAVTLNGRTLAGSSEGGAGGSDSLTFTFVGTEDCLGTVAPGGPTLIAQRYYRDADGGLSCQSSLVANGQQLIPGVEELEVLYGIREGSETPPVISRYVTANNVGDNPVMAIKIAVLLSAPAGFGSAASGDVTFNLLNKSVTRPIDNRLRRSFQRTIALRNFPWEN